MLPDALVQLFHEPSIVYVGSRLKGDIDKLGEDFGIVEISRSVTYRDLAKMAKDCGKVPDAKSWPTNISYGASVIEYGQG
jgi:hypothetical protein